MYLDHVASTTGIIRFAAETDAREVIVGTESGILHRLRAENPKKRFYEASPVADCPNMKLTTLEKVLWSLKDMAHEVTVPEETRRKASKAIEKMLATR